MLAKIRNRITRKTQRPTAEAHAAQLVALAEAHAAISVAELARERVEAENTRMKAELRRSSTIINASLNPSWQRDAALNIVYSNLAFMELAEEIGDAAFTPGELYTGHRSLAQRAWDTGQEQTERRHIVVHGQRRLYTIREVPMPSDQCVLGYAVHIGELEEAQAEIQRHISAMRDLLESSTSAMAIYGRDQRLKAFNFAFVALWKLDESWLHTEPTYGEVLELLREKRKLPEQANFKAFKQAQQKLFTDLISPEEEFFFLPDGKTLRVIAIPHALGGVFFAYEDVTDRLALERSYNTLIAVQRETLDHLHEGVVVFNENGRLSLSNPIFLKLWNLDGEFTSREPRLREWLEACRSLFVAEDLDAYISNLMARFTQRQFVAMRLERTDGTVVDCACVPLPDGATMLSFVDVTDSTLVERSLRERTEALEAADRLKTEFLANMSYELRSPLTSISGFAEMLKGEYVGPLNPMQQEYVGGIFQSSQQLASLISDIIDLATIEAGYMKLDLAPCDMGDTIRAAVGLLEEKLKSQHVAIQTEIPADLAPILADETRVKQILITLISNAVKRSKSKGSITVLLQSDGEGYLTLTVRDDGAAMDADRRAHLFDPFFRGAAGKGTEASLGLSLVKRIMELHGGEVSLLGSDTEEGVGIVCRFPRADLTLPV